MLEDAKPGDTIVIWMRIGVPRPTPTRHTIARVTPTQVVTTEGLKYFKINGVYVNNRRSRFFAAPEGWTPSKKV